MKTPTPTQPARHTPGPWKATPAPASEGAPQGSLTVRYAGPDHAWHIATVYGEEPGTTLRQKHGHAAANAALIAAAPDLLAACEAVRQTVTAHAARYPGDREAQAEAAALTAAIRKARGAA